MTSTPTFYDLNRDDLSGMSEEISCATAMLSHTFEEASFVGLMRLSENELKNYLWAVHSRVSEAGRRMSRVLERNRFCTAAEAATFEDKAAGEEYACTDSVLEFLRNRRGFNLLDQALKLAQKSESDPDCSPYSRDVLQVIQDFVGEAKSTLAHKERPKRGEVDGPLGERVRACEQATERVVQTLSWVSADRNEDLADALVRRVHELVAASHALSDDIKGEEADGDSGLPDGEVSV